MLRRIFSAVLFISAVIYVIFSQPHGIETSSAQQNQISFWGIYDLQEVYHPIIDEFKKQYPEIDVVYKQFPNREEYQEVLEIQLKRGKGPDIFLFPDSKSEFYKEFINPTSAVLAEGFAPLVQQHLVEKRLLYGLPLWIDSLMLYYNKRYYPDGIAANWHEFAEQTREVNAGGIAMGRLDNIISGWDILRSLFLQKEVLLAGNPANNVFDTLEFFTRFAYPIDRYFNWSDTLNKNYPDAEVDSFAREKVAAIAGFSPLIDLLHVKHDQLKDKGIRRTKRENIAVATFPQFNPEKPKYLANYVALGVSIYSPLPNHAWDFIELLTNASNASYFLQATGRTPGRILSEQDSDTQMQRVQKQQAAHSYVYPVSEEVKEKIMQVQERGVKDISLLREILSQEL